jgi:FkbM family methyltransferase
MSSEAAMLDLKRVMRAFGHVRRSSEVFRCVAGLREWPYAVTGYLGLSQPKLPATLHLRKGVVFNIEEFYDLETLWQVWFRRIYPVKDSDRVIIDAGANVGFFSIYAASQNPECKIWAIEPFAATFERLVRTVADNGFSNRVSCHPIALASSTASRLMTSSSAPSQLMSLLPPGSASVGTASVTAVTLADFLDENGIENVDLLKMDIEGSEFEVLLTAGIETLRRIRRVELEYHERQGPESKKDLIRRLEEAGFRKTFDTDQDAVYGLARFERQ